MKSKQINYAKERKTQGRLLGDAVREIAELVHSIADQQGIDLQERLTEASRKSEEEDDFLVERLKESVLPLFIGDQSGPARIGSGVLVRLGSKCFVFTAAHVMRDAGTAHLFAPAGAKGGKLVPLPPYLVHLSPPPPESDLDLGILEFQEPISGPFSRRVFLAGAEIDEDDRPDVHHIASFYLAVGYPASRTQLRVSKAERHIHQLLFRLSTSVVDAAEYEERKVSRSDHILLDFDHKEIKVAGRKASPPKLQGASGGGIFEISRNTRGCLLVGIATKNPSRFRLIVGTRIKHFLAMARELNALPPQI
jgi:hypothetical protein